MMEHKKLQYFKQLDTLVDTFSFCYLFTVRPSFIMPYLVGFVDEIEKASFLRKFNVPFWAVSYVFGKDPMYWYRIEQSIGRNSIVGTTIRNSEDVPNHLAADEKHTRILGDKTYVATTVGGGCILGAAVAKDAGEQALTDAYNVYKQEAQCIKPEYSPETVNMDGWKATRNAWQTLFPAVVIICCFLHVFIKIRDRAKKKYRDIFESVATKVWECYRAESKGSFSQRIRRLVEWCETNDAPLSSLILSKSCGITLPAIELPMIIRKLIEPAIWLTG